MERNKAEGLVKTVLAEHGLMYPDEYKDTSTLFELAIDSLDLVEVALSLEDSLNVDEFKPQQISELKTVGDIVALVMKYDYKTEKPTVYNE